MNEPASGAPRDRPQRNVGVQFNKPTAENTLGPASAHFLPKIHPALHYHYRYHICLGMLAMTMTGPSQRANIHLAQPIGRSAFSQASASPVFVTDASTLDSRKLKLSIQRANGLEGEALVPDVGAYRAAEPSGAAPCPVQHAAVVLRQRQQPFTSSDFVLVPRRPTPTLASASSPSAASSASTYLETHLFFF